MDDSAKRGGYIVFCLPIICVTKTYGSSVLFLTEGGGVKYQNPHQYLRSVPSKLIETTLYRNISP